MSFPNSNPVAVLVDAESVDASDARSAIAALSAKFAPLILHAFGDFRSPYMQAWCHVLDEFEGQALQVTPIEGHHNGLHVCLTMNAMEIVHTDRASAICLFCGDGDFSQLAVRIRKAGLPVLGFGTEEAGRVMAPWFDSWHVIGDEDAQPAEDLPEDDLSSEDIEPFANLDGTNAEEEGWRAPEDLKDPAPDPVISMAPEHEQSDEYGDVTDADIEVAVQQARSRRERGGRKGDIAAIALEGNWPNDVEVMAAIEGKRTIELAKIDQAPPMFREVGDDVLPDDATMLLSGFIADNLTANGYALLADVAEAATATGILVPPEKKKQANDYLKQLIAHDHRFEVTMLPTEEGEPEFIRRV